MSTAKHKLTKDELERPFASDAGAHIGPVLSPADLAALLSISVKTIYEWLAKGRLDGAFRKRGKHILLWRTRALDVIMNGKDWNND